MPDEAFEPRDSYRLWITLAVVFIMIFLTVNFFMQFSSALANQDSTQKEMQIEEESADQEVLVPDSPSPVSQWVNKIFFSPPRLKLPNDPPAGTSLISPIDGMNLIYIPASNIRLGANTKIHYPGHNVRHYATVSLDPFWISQTQVTNAMYATCVNAGACRKAIRKAINPHYYDPKYANHPVVYVTWSDSVLYCKWSGGYLPTEAQWEKAAQGKGSSDYPWGDKTRISLLANVGNHQKTTVPVGSYPDGASPYGVLDMGGNVREWVQDWFAESYLIQPPYENPQGPSSGKLRLLKGASWHDSVKSAIIDSHFAHQPGSAGNNRGFRCVYKAQG